MTTFLRLHGLQSPTSRINWRWYHHANHEQGKELTQLLDHLALQDIEKGVFEVIVVDNGSDVPVTDTISEDDYAFKLNIIKQERAQPPSKNMGIDALKGRWVLFFDAASVPVTSSIRQHIIAQMSSPRAYAVIWTRPRSRLVNNSFRRLVDKPMFMGTTSDS